MTEEELTKIEERANEASSAPWRHQTAAADDAPDDFGAVKSGDGYLIVTDAPDADCSFIAHSRVDVPNLLAEVRRLRHALTAVVIMPSRSIDGIPYPAGQIEQAMRDMAHWALGGAQ
jgi:hypothetical protein